MADAHADRASSRCNLRCTYCPVGTEIGPTGHMELDVFKKFVDDVYRHALVIVLWGWGEPFICPSVYEMIDYAHTKGVRLVSSTNGHFVRQARARRRRRALRIGCSHRLAQRHDAGSVCALSRRALGHRARRRARDRRVPSAASGRERRTCS
jgi:uncharacterized radical SAM superfamily Fe-S cluster-containing enzyme